MAQRAPLLAFAAAISRDAAATAARWDGLFCMLNGRTLLDTTAIPYLFPHRFSDLPFGDASFDIVVFGGAGARAQPGRRPGRAAVAAAFIIRPKPAFFQLFLRCQS